MRVTRATGRHRVSCFFSFPRTLVLLHQSPVGPDHCQCLWAGEQWQPLSSLCVSALSLDLVFFLLMPPQPRSVIALIPSPPHTCKSNFYFIQMFIHLSYMYVVTSSCCFSCGMKTGDLTTTEVGNLTQRREDPGM